MKHNLEQWIAQLDYDDTCDITDRQVSDLIRNYAALEDRCAALVAKGMEVVREASLIYSKYNDTQMPDRDIVDQQTLQELYEICTADDGAAYLAEVRAQGVDEFLRGSQLPYQIATVLADYDNVDDATLQTIIWSGQPPEPDGDVWHLEYVSRGNAIVRAVLNELRKGVI